jgi:hypothetical protein
MWNFTSLMFSLVARGDAVVSVGGQFSANNHDLVTAFCSAKSDASMPAEPDCIGCT